MSTDTFSNKFSIKNRHKYFLILVILTICLIWIISISCTYFNKLKISENVNSRLKRGAKTPHKHHHRPSHNPKTTPKTVPNVANKNPKIPPVTTKPTTKKMTTKLATKKPTPKLTTKSPSPIPAQQKSTFVLPNAQPFQTYSDQKETPSTLYTPQQNSKFNQNSNLNSGKQAQVSLPRDMNILNKIAQFKTYDENESPDTPGAGHAENSNFQKFQDLEQAGQNTVTKTPGFVIQHVNQIVRSATMDPNLGKTTTKAPSSFKLQKVDQITRSTNHDSKQVQVTKAPSSFVTQKAGLITKSPNFDAKKVEQITKSSNKHHGGRKPTRKFRPFEENFEDEIVLPGVKTQPQIPKNTPSILIKIQPTVPKAEYNQNPVTIVKKFESPAKSYPESQNSLTQNPSQNEKFLLKDSDNPIKSKIHFNKESNKIEFNKESKNLVPTDNNEEFITFPTKSSYISWTKKPSIDESAEEITKATTTAYKSYSEKGESVTKSSYISVTKRPSYDDSAEEITKSTISHKSYSDKEEFVTKISYTSVTKRPSYDESAEEITKASSAYKSYSKKPKKVKLSEVFKKYEYSDSDPGGKYNEDDSLFDQSPKISKITPNKPSKNTKIEIIRKTEISNNFESDGNLNDDDLIQTLNAQLPKKSYAKKSENSESQKLYEAKKNYNDDNDDEMTPTVRTQQIATKKPNYANQNTLPNLKKSEYTSTVTRAPEIKKVATTTQSAVVDEKKIEEYAQYLHVPISYLKSSHPSFEQSENSPIKNSNQETSNYNGNQVDVSKSAPVKQNTDNGNYNNNNAYSGSTQAKPQPIDWTRYATFNNFG